MVPTDPGLEFETVGFDVFKALAFSAAAIACSCSIRACRINYNFF